MFRNKCRKRCCDLWEYMGVIQCQHMYDRRYVGMMACVGTARAKHLLYFQNRFVGASFLWKDDWM